MNVAAQIVGAIFVGAITVSAPIGLLAYLLLVIGRVVGGRVGLNIAGGLGVALGTAPLAGVATWILWCLARYGNPEGALLAQTIAWLGFAAMIAFGVTGAFFFGWVQQRMMLVERAAR